MSKNKGVTLIELILYVAILTVLLGGAFKFVLDVVTVRYKAEDNRDIIYNSRFVSNVIEREIKNAKTISSSGSKNLTTDTAVISETSNNLFLNSKQLNSSRISVDSNFVVTTSGTNSKHVDYSIIFSDGNKQIGISGVAEQRSSL